MIQKKKRYLIMVFICSGLTLSGFLSIILMGDLIPNLSTALQFGIILVPIVILYYNHVNTINEKYEGLEVKVRNFIKKIKQVLDFLENYERSRNFTSEEPSITTSLINTITMTQTEEIFRKYVKELEMEDEIIKSKLKCVFGDLEHLSFELLDEFTLGIYTRKEFRERILEEIVEILKSKYVLEFLRKKFK